MANSKQLTKGEIERREKEAQRKEEQRKRQEEAKNQIMRKKLYQEIAGTYKKTVENSFVKVFAKNYEESLDYNSLMKSITFNIKEDHEGYLRPDFSIDKSKIKFNSDIKKSEKPFNENSYKDFISNETIIYGDELLSDFGSIEEKEIYDETLKGQFIPTISNKDRYSAFNKINKTLGYAPIERAIQQATKETQDAWDKQSKTAISNLLKKSKL